VKVTPWRAWLIGWAGALVLRVIGRTWRIHRSGHEPPDWHAIGAFLHGDLLMVAWVFRGFRAAVLISQHGDGELIAQAAARLGNHPVRGSSTRGGARAALEVLRKWADRPWGITPDGPRGPRGTVHEGVIQLASEGRRRILPLGFAYSRGRRLSSWDRFAIPYPFSRVIVHIGEPVSVPADVDRDARRAIAGRLEEALVECQLAAERSLDAKKPQANWPPRPRRPSPGR
jgi:lysophospholipid acyltransferase (LPLAT)-like uncharacterized protein